MENLKEAMDLLKKGDYEERAYASALSGSSKIPIDELVRLRDRPENKRIILTAIGLRQQQYKKASFEMASKLNYDKRFPNLLIAQAIAEAK